MSKLEQAPSGSRHGLEVNVDVNVRQKSYSRFYFLDTSRILIFWTVSEFQPIPELVNSGSFKNFYVLDHPNIF